MNLFGLNICCAAILFLLVNSTESLRCRSGNQQSNDQLYKIMQTCRKKYSSNGNKNSNDYTTSSENDSSNEDSASSVSLDEELFFGNSNKKSGSNSTKNAGNYQSTNGNYGESRRNDRRKQESYVNRQYSSNPTNYNWTNDQDNGMSGQNNNRNNYGSGMQSQNRDNSDNERRDRNECVTQCFFDELNLVDQRGFPERGSVMEIMTRGIQDPNLRDFMEESVSECFHYLDSDASNRDKCTFAKNLMSCFADKGRDRCEDWED